MPKLLIWLGIAAVIASIVAGLAYILLSVPSLLAAFFVAVFYICLFGVALYYLCGPRDL